MVIQTAGEAQQAFGGPLIQAVKRGKKKAAFPDFDKDIFVKASSKSAQRVAQPVASPARKKVSPGKIPAKAECLRLYEKMFLLRHFEQTAGALYKKGEMPGFIHLYVGEEATGVGICAHLRTDDWITSTHRGHGHALAKGMPARSLMAELYAKETGCCGGRGGSMHLYNPAFGIFGTNGIVGAGIPHAVGVGIGARVRKTDQVAVAFFGDGAINHGAFHESLNFAGVQKSPTIFLCENNLYATATPLTMATLNTEVATRAAAYGVPGIAVDGNDVLAVWRVMDEAVARARRGEGPTLIEAKTYRTVGHHEGEALVGTYRTQEELDLWKTRDPILRFRRQLTEELKLASVAELDGLEQKVRQEIEEAVEFARKSPQPELHSYLRDAWSSPINAHLSKLPVGLAGPAATQGWLEAVRDGIAEEMRTNPNTLYFGEGIGERGGSFAHTKELWKEFGAQRVVDTPISELGFTGAAIGASATGVRAIADLMFVDFLFETGGQVPLQLSKLRYMSNGQMCAPVIIRAPCGAIKCAGPHHSGTYHSIWAHFPGLIVVMPSNPADAKGLMKSALRGSDPVIFLEPKALFSSKGEVPSGEHLVPFGVARVAREGRDLTLVTVGRMVLLSLEAAGKLEKEGISIEVIDLRTIVPLDFPTVMASVARTGRLLVVDEGYAMCGLAAEIAAAVGEEAFDELDAPVGRLTMEPVSHPLNPGLEGECMPTVEKILVAAKEVIDGKPTLPKRPVVAGRVPPAASQTPVTVPAVASVPSAPTPAAVPSRPAAPAAVASNGAVGEPLILPHGDLTVNEATVVKWLKKTGESFQKDEPIVDVETEKAVSSVEAPFAGRLSEILIPVGEKVKMGTTLGLISKV
jgi:2-oxoisovalerate dehydrogenase E1 component